MSRYVSPMTRAREIVRESKSAATSRQVLNHAMRIVRLASMVIVDLERNEAPVHVFRWIAWASTVTDQRRRTDLAIYLRRSIHRPRNGWLQERHYYAALTEWDKARCEMRKRGSIMPSFDEIPLDAYRAAIEGATTFCGSSPTSSARRLLRRTWRPRTWPTMRSRACADGARWSAERRPTWVT